MQVFKRVVPYSIVINIIHEICIRNNNNYLFTYLQYKKAEYNNHIAHVCDSLYEYYIDSKKHYVTRIHTYNSFNTIIRQLCKLHNILFTISVKYNISRSYSEYTIYLEDNTPSEKKNETN